MSVPLLIHGNESCPILFDPQDCSLWDFSVRGIFQVRILEWVSISSSRESSQPRDQTHVSCISCIAGGFFTNEPRGKPPLAIPQYKVKGVFVCLFLEVWCLCQDCRRVQDDETSLSFWSKYPSWLRLLDSLKLYWCGSFLIFLGINLPHLVCLCLPKQPADLFLPTHQALLAWWHLCRGPGLYPVDWWDDQSF